MYNFAKTSAAFTTVVCIRRHRLFLQRNALIRALLSVSLAAIALMMLLAFETKAQVPTLEGETFQGAEIRNAKISCDPTVGRIDFALQGVAVGPYPGTFTETGTLTFDPVLGLTTGGAFGFTVSNEAGTVTVTGKKSPLDGKALCTIDRTGITTIIATVPTLDHSALVDVSQDSGQATLDLFASIDKSVGLTALKFTEIFHSSNLVRSTFGKITGGGNISQAGGGSGVTFGFNAQNTENGFKGSGTIIDHNAGINVKILDVVTFSISGTHGTFIGRAEVNGIEERYRIDVDDLGEPGTGMDSFKIVTDTYGTGGILAGGNIQVHK